MVGFDLAQTFYFDKDAVQGADTAYVTSINLYFYGKPVAGNTKTGIVKPGVSLYMCKTYDDGSPNLEIVHNMFSSRVEYDNISVSTTGSTATTFTLNQPVPLPTNRSYGFLLRFDGSDDDFKLWCNKAGQNILNTNTPTQVTSGKVDGYLYKITNGVNLTPERDTDLSFTMSVAKFSSSSQTFKIINRSYETLKVNSTSGRFKGGEDVYVLGANAAGTVAISETSTLIVGTGTAFSSVVAINDHFVITDGTPGNTEIRTVVSIAGANLVIDVAPSFSNTAGHYYLPVTGKVFMFDDMSDHLIIQDATTTATRYINTNDYIYGVDSLALTRVTSVLDYAINSVIPNFNIVTPAGSSVTTTLNFANSAYNVSSSRKQDVTLGVRKILHEYPAVMASASHEETAATPFSSFQGELVFTTTNPYVSPYVREDNLDLFLERYEINNDSTNEYMGRGNAKARYISKTVTLDADAQAEDLKVFVRAHKPSNTTIEVYAKLRNSQDPETIDLKNWMQLTLTGNTSYISNPTSLSDYGEFTYSIPGYGPGTVANGTFTTTLSSAIVTGTAANVSASVSTGSIVRLYSSFLANTYIVDSVASSNATTFTLTNAIANSSLVATGLQVSVMSRPYSGFIDIQKQNVYTYFNQSLSRFETFDSMTLKIVLLSDNSVSIPYVDDIRAIAVSA